MSTISKLAVGIALCSCALFTGFRPLTTTQTNALPFSVTNQTGNFFGMSPVIAGPDTTMLNIGVFGTFTTQLRWPAQYIIIDGQQCDVTTESEIFLPDGGEVIVSPSGPNSVTIQNPEIVDIERRLF